MEYAQLTKWRLKREIGMWRCAVYDLNGEKLTGSTKGSGI